MHESTLICCRKLYNLNVIKEDIFAYAYIYPLSNVGGYMIGIICGYLFYYYKDKQLFTNKVTKFS